MLHLSCDAPDEVFGRHSQIAHRRIVAGWEILRNHGRNNNSQAQVMLSIILIG
jgi:hypothetical protein